jgi:cell division protein ZapE
MSPLQKYHQLIQASDLVVDKNQLLVMEKLNHIAKDLEAEDLARQDFWHFLRQTRGVRGLYLCGGVGIGKTFMMDCFFSAVAIDKKIRLHFHQFMNSVHAELIALQGEKNPIDIIARNFAQKYLLLCFDEFFVIDIADAMILGKLLTLLFSYKVCVVLTSNVLPDNLYLRGLQRLQFQPAIKALKLNTEVVAIPSTVDYRLRHLTKAGVFFTPLTTTTKQQIEYCFHVLAQGKTIDTHPVEINGRSIRTIARTDDSIWFEFREICGVPRSQNDYLEISMRYHNVFISNLAPILANEKDIVALFVNLVDVFYDARIRVILSSATPIEGIYPQGYKKQEFIRTQSRLLEMQSTDYYSH